MITLLHSSTQRAAIYEARALLTMARRTGEDIVALIAVPQDVREELEAFCRTHPLEAFEIEEALRMRDSMLAYLTYFRQRNEDTNEV